MAQSQIPTIGRDFSEIGRTGLNRWGGHVHEEFLRELQGSQGTKAYREMIAPVLVERVIKEVE